MILALCASIIYMFGDSFLDLGLAGWRGGEGARTGDRSITFFSHCRRSHLIYVAYTYMVVSQNKGTPI